jgi:hypothetical protein
MRAFFMRGATAGRIASAGSIAAGSGTAWRRSDVIGDSAVSGANVEAPAGAFRVSAIGDRGGRLLHSRFGEVSEWLKVPLSKSGVVMSHRGFESHPLRQRDG